MPQNPQNRSSAENRTAKLIDQFIACFPQLNEMAVFEHIDPIDASLWTGELDQLGRKLWRPAKISTDASRLDPIYAQLPARFPPLFEYLVLNYRWIEVDLGLFTLMANPPGPDLSGLLVRDPHLGDFLLPRGYIQFAKGPDFDYDPVCFDISSRTKSGDYKIVKIDHEQILCNNKLRTVSHLAPSFEALLKSTIAAANSA